MRQQLVICAALGLVLSTAGCRKKDPSPAERLVGEWQWVRSIGGFTGRMVRKPQPGQVVTLRFTADGYWQQCSQGKCTDLMPYTVGRATSYLHNDERLILTMQHTSSQNLPGSSPPLMIANVLVEYSDTLRYDNDNPDGYESTYFRR